MRDHIEQNPVHLGYQEHFDRKLRREEKIKKKSLRKATKDFRKAKKLLDRHLVKRYYRGRGSGGREEKDSYY